MCLYYDHAKQANDNGLVLYCTLIDYVVIMYDTYNTIERMSVSCSTRGWEETLICGFLIFLLRVN